jgi:outer membrane lipoprotein carrier protein
LKPNWPRRVHYTGHLGLMMLGWKRCTGTVAILAIMLIAAVATPGTACEAAKSGKADFNRLLDALQQHYQETSSFSARFAEEITPVGAPARRRDGIVYFRKPGRMRWEFETPTKELVVSDGSTVYSYDPDLNQVVETPLRQALRAPGATEFLLGAGNLKTDFDASAVTPLPDDGLVHLLLKPKKGGDGIEIGLDPKTCDIRSLHIKDQIGNLTAIRFSNINKQAKFDEGKFEFKVPEGADVVRSEPQK